MVISHWISIRRKRMHDVIEGTMNPDILISVKLYNKLSRSTYKKVICINNMSNNTLNKYVDVHLIYGANRSGNVVVKTRKCIKNVAPSGEHFSIKLLCMCKINSKEFKRSSCRISHIDECETLKWRAIYRAQKPSRLKMSSSNSLIFYQGKYK